MDCPNDFATRAEILHRNGFTGYQPPNVGTNKNKCYICWVDDLSSEQVNNIKELSGSQTLNHGECQGYYFISIRWNEYHKIKDIFNAMLLLGLSFTTNNKAAAKFNPNEDPEFTDELMEQKAIQNVKLILETVPNSIYNDFFISSVYFDIWNYKTQNGKEFCNYLRGKRNLGPSDINDKNNYFNWDIFKNCDFNTLQTVDELNVVNMEEDDEDLCIICMENPPETLVLPCGDCTVCKTCSEGLKNTSDHHTCVKCRRPIIDILTN
jgi:hypothetical protein